MQGMIAISDLYDEKLDPALMDITTKPGQACRNCIFQRQRVSVCNEAVALAVRAGMGNCDNEDVIYVKRETDPRQLKIEG